MKEFQQQGTPPDNPNMSMGAPPPAPATFGKFIKVVMLWSGGGAVIGMILVLSTAFLPANWSVGHWIAVTVSQMEATEIRGVMRTKAEAARLLVAAQAEAQALTTSIQESMAGEIAMGQLGDYACLASKFFGQGRASDYPEIRDGLKMGCGLSEAARQDIVNNLVFRLRDLRKYIAELEAAAR